MKNSKRKIIYIILGLVVCVIIVRETGLFDFHRFKAETYKEVGPWNRKYLYAVPNQIQLVYKDKIVCSEGIESGSGTFKIIVDEYNERWSPWHLVPFYKTGTTKMFVRIQIILPENQDGGGDLIGFEYKKTVKGFCSSRYYRRSIIEDVNKSIVSYIKGSMIKNAAENVVLEQ